MKFAAKSLLFLMSLAATFTYAQTLPPGTFKHIIIVVQENRTPDNLFGSGSSGTKCGIEVPFEPGVHGEELRHVADCAAVLRRCERARQPARKHSAVRLLPAAA